MDLLLEAPWTRGDLLSAFGLVVSVVGFGFAAAQLVRTARATEATAQGVRAASRSQLMLLLPQFKLLELDLDHALDHDNRAQAVRVLTSCAHLANEVAGLVERDPVAFPGVEINAIEELRQVASAAAAAKSTIYESPQKKLVTITKGFRESFGTSMQTISQLQMASTAVGSRKS